MGDYFCGVMFSDGIDPEQFIAHCNINTWYQPVAWIENSPFWGLTAEMECGGFSLSFTCSADISFPMHFPKRFPVPGFLRTLSQRQQLVLVPQRSCCASFTELRAAWAFPGSQPIRWSSFSSELPGVRLSQFPLFPCPSPICTFSLPSSLGSSRWSAVETLCCYRPHGVVWFCLCHNFTAEKF